MKRKALLSVPLAILAILAVGAFAAPSVQAHDGVASGTCNGGVQWSYTNYSASQVNSITVTIDGVVRYHDGDFKTSDTGTIATDKTVAHTWDVLVDAPGTQFDRHPNGSYVACVVPPTSTVAPTTTQVTTTTLPATTTLPEVTTTLPEATTTSVVEIITPPVPCPYNPSVPTGSPLCVPPVAEDVVALTPAEPALPITGAGDTVALIVLALIMIGTGWYLARKGRRVS